MLGFSEAARILPHRPKMSNRGTTIRRLSGDFGYAALACVTRTAARCHPEAATQNVVILSGGRFGRSEGSVCCNDKPSHCHVFKPSHC
jgi:hypothetical protein